MGIEGENGRDRHHREQRANDGPDEAWNISWVDIKSHRAFHYLFGNLSVVGIATLLNKVWLPVDWRVVAVGSEGFMALLQLAYWFIAKKEDNRENMDGGGI